MSDEQDLVEIDALDLIPADAGVLDEIIRQAESRMQAQLQLAVAADARAGLLGTVQGTASSALFVVAAQNITSSALAPTLAAAGVLALGTVLAAIASRPVLFGYPGTRPRDWLEDVRSGTTLIRARADSAKILDKYLIMNEKTMKTNNAWASRSILCLVAAPVVSALLLLPPVIALVAPSAPRSISTTHRVSPQHQGAGADANRTGNARPS